MRQRILAFSSTGSAFLRDRDQLETLGDHSELLQRPICEVSLTADTDEYVWQVTACGVVKCTHASDFRSATRKAGVRSIDLDEGDRLAAAFVLAERSRDADVVIVTAGGIATRFSSEDVRPMVRLARGVRGISLAAGDAGEPADEVAAAFPVEVGNADCSIGVLTASRFAIRFPASDLSVHGRGFPGFIACRTTTETGPVTFAGTLLANGQAVDQLSPRQWVQVPWATVPVRRRRTGKWASMEKSASLGSI